MVEISGCVLTFKEEYKGKPKRSSSPQQNSVHNMQKLLRIGSKQCTAIFLFTRRLQIGTRIGLGQVVALIHKKLVLMCGHLQNVEAYFAIYSRHAFESLEMNNV